MWQTGWWSFAPRFAGEPALAPAGGATHGQVASLSTARQRFPGLREPKPGQGTSGVSGGSEPLGAGRPSRGSAAMRRRGGRIPSRFPPGLQAPPAPRQAEREPGCSLPDAAAPAAPQRGPTPSLPKPAGCATPLAARENPFLASASSSRILEHVSECITARSLIEIQLGDLALLPLHGQLLRGWQSEPGVTPDRDRDGDGDREGSSAAQPGASSTPGACTAGGCRLCPSSPGQQTLRCPSWRCPCPVPTLSRGTVALQGTRAPPPKPYSLHRCHPG